MSRTRVAYRWQPSPDPYAAAVLFVHEVHAVVGRDADAFDTLYRDEWVPALADGEGARLLWYLHQAHGTGPAYTVVTITALASAEAWLALG